MKIEDVEIGKEYHDSEEVVRCTAIYRHEEDVFEYVLVKTRDGTKKKIGSAYLRPHDPVLEKAKELYKVRYPGGNLEDECPLALDGWYRVARHVLGLPPQ